VVHVVVHKIVVKLAPADEYFGPLKMSVLGIRNEIHDLAIKYDVRADGDHALAKRIMGVALMTEASLSDWQKKYPGDNQLARDVYLLQHLYAKIDYDAARAKAKYVAQWLLSRYPTSWYAKNLRTAMARTPASQPATAPSPSGTETPAASPAPSEAPAATTLTGGSSGGTAAKSTGPSGTGSSAGATMPSGASSGGSPVGPPAGSSPSALPATIIAAPTPTPGAP
jgi:hypothetical protein